MLNRNKNQHLARIALIEDDEGYVILLRKMLSRKGICNEIILFDNGYKFLDYIAEPGNISSNTFVLLDLNLPLMNGFQLLKKIRAVYPKKELPIIVMSTTARENDITLSYELGCDAFLKKPINYDDLIATAISLGTNFALTVAPEENTGADNARIKITREGK